MEVKSPFDYVKSINGNSSVSIMADESDRKQYLPFIINRSLSYHMDTIMLANEMNLNSHLDVREQYDFLRLTVRPRKRFAKFQKTTHEEDADVLVQEYSMNRQRAEEALRFLSKDEINRLRVKQQHGGMSQNK